MKKVLNHSNRDLLNDIIRIDRLLKSKKDLIPKELQSYYDWITSECSRLRFQVEQNLRDLGLGRNEILPDLVSATQVVTVRLRLLNQHLLSPILHSGPDDVVGLRILEWLHHIHQQTVGIPFAISDGEFAVWPAKDFPAVYFMPPSAQLGLLYLPLFFHEFGHVLYACHRSEMDDLARELQRRIGFLLEPSVQRNDLNEQADILRRQRIQETWYDWTQELFCDAIGLVIGGPAFLDALSSYMKMMGRQQYHLAQDKLFGQSHPVTWQRIRLLADRAKSMGYSDQARELEDVWQSIAECQQITEDYYGFFEASFVPEIHRTIDDMIIESEPQMHESGSRVLVFDPVSSSSPTPLLNNAWDRFKRDPESYLEWEQKMTSRLSNKSWFCVKEER